MSPTDAQVARDCTTEFEDCYIPEYERAEIVLREDGPGYVAVVSYKDHHISSGRQASKKKALKKLVQLAVELWVNA